jgi:hypothetical protein
MLSTKMKGSQVSQSPHVSIGVNRPTMQYYHRWRCYDHYTDAWHTTSCCVDTTWYLEPCARVVGRVQLGHKGLNSYVQIAMFY